MAPPRKNRIPRNHRVNLEKQNMPRKVAGLNAPVKRPKETEPVWFLEQFKLSILKTRNRMAACATHPVPTLPMKNFQIGTSAFERSFLWRARRSFRIAMF